MPFSEDSFRVRHRDTTSNVDESPFGHFSRCVAGRFASASVGASTICAKYITWCLV